MNVRELIQLLLKQKDLEQEVVFEIDDNKFYTNFMLAEYGGIKSTSGPFLSFGQFGKQIK